VTALNYRASGSGPVLEGAFAVLDALARTEDGLGLTALARTSGLAKTSAYRLTQQLVALDAVQSVGRRYYLGPWTDGINQRWIPDPLLRQAAKAAVHTLAVQSSATASLRILHNNRLRVICAAAPEGHAYMPSPGDPESIARTATGRVLYATQPASDVALPGCWTQHEWRKLRESIGERNLRRRGHRAGAGAQASPEPARPRVAHGASNRCRSAVTKPQEGSVWRMMRWWTVVRWAD
jgi:DNA-binding IclR family transcriptional regulator